MLHLEVGLRKSRRAHAVRNGAKEVHVCGVLEAKADIILWEDVVHIRETQNHLVHRKLEPMR
jgi:hypothetical protein